MELKKNTVVAISIEAKYKVLREAFCFKGYMT